VGKVGTKFSIEVWTDCAGRHARKRREERKRGRERKKEATNLPVPRRGFQRPHHVSEAKEEKGGVV
jgi:hypothetical protein